MGQDRAALTAVAAVTAGVVLVAVLVTWAASIGPSGVLTGEGLDPVRATPTQVDCPTTGGLDVAVDPERAGLPSQASTCPTPESFADDDGQGEDAADGGAADGFALRAIAYLLEGLAALGVCYLLWRGGRRAHQAWEARRRPPPEPEEVDFEVIEQAQRALTEELVRDAALQREVLLGGNPRNAIVECWHRFEQRATDAGLARRDWETSSEFTLRMLDLAHADGHAVARLAALYREARFSEHEIGESDRAAAVEALELVHRSLGQAAR